MRVTHPAAGWTAPLHQTHADTWPQLYLSLTLSSLVGPSVANSSFQTATPVMKRAATSVAGPIYECQRGLQQARNLWFAAHPERMQQHTIQLAGNAHLYRNWCGGNGHVDLVCLASPVRLPAAHMLSARRALNRGAAGTASAVVCCAPLPGPSRRLAVQTASSRVMQDLHLAWVTCAKPQCRSIELWYQLLRIHGRGQSSVCKIKQI